MSGPPIPDGAVLVDADGRIAAVGPHADVPRPDDAADEHFPSCVLVPGFVNAHTHLELTGLGGPIERPSFFDWIEEIRTSKAHLSPAAYLAAARLGIRHAWSRGITTVADTGSSGAAARALTELEASGVAYHEVFGPHPEQAEDATRSLLAEVAAQREAAGPRVRIGVSPHAPYSVSEMLYRKVAETARTENYPIAIHLAESAAETDLVTSGRGPFADMWVRRNIPLPRPAGSPVAYVDRTGILGDETLVIHAVQCDAADVARLAGAGSPVVCCPCSNEAHGHGSPPVEALRAHGLRLAVGTDSVASVGAIELLEDARTMGRIGKLTDDEVLDLLTKGGARALGLEAEIGTVEPGKWADLTLIRLAPGRPPVPAVVNSKPTDVVRTYLGGRVVFGEEHR